MNCKEIQVLSIPHIVGDIADSERNHQLQVHLLSCPSCAQQYEVLAETLTFITDHRALFAAALESLDAGEAARQSELESSWRAILNKLAPIETRHKRARLIRTVWMVSAAAACIIVAACLWSTLSPVGTQQNLRSPQDNVAAASSLWVELLSADDTVIIPTDTEVKTPAGEIKTLIINGEHRIVMNSHTVLSIHRLAASDLAGCLVNLASGEIYAHVQPDGARFVVATAHGKAIVTGTIFDVSSTDDKTTLAVAEGNVTFASEYGSVQVAAQQISEISGQSAPTEPRTWNTTKYTAWATGGRNSTRMTRPHSSPEAYDLTDLWLSATSGPVELESVDYEAWIEDKRAWFKKEFPWIFEIKEALAQQDIRVDYQTLLINSGDVWQFAYPVTSSGHIAAADFNSLLKTAGQYGFNREWLLKNVSHARPATDSPVPQTALNAFQRWAASLHKAAKSSAQPDAGALLYCLYADTYLIQTRMLLWFAVHKDQYSLSSAAKARLLTTLEEQIDHACKCRADILVLYRADKQNEPCEAYKCRQLLYRIADFASTAAGIEQEISKYGIRK